MMCLLNNVGYNFQTYMERWLKGVFLNARSNIPNFSLHLRYVIEVFIMNILRYPIVH